MIYEIQKPEIVVVGCGVIGLTCAIRLQERFKVRVFADKKPADTTSDRAAAVWYPYDLDPQNDSRIRDWCQSTYSKLDVLSREAGSSVSFVKFVEVFEYQKEFQQKQKEGSLWWSSMPRSFCHPASNLPKCYEYGYEVEVPLMDTEGYLTFLESKLKREIEFTSDICHLAKLYRCYPRIVNCTGVWAGELVGDHKVYPNRGQVVVIRKPQSIDRCFIHIKEILASDPELTYIVPRGNDCILGGTAEKDNWDEAKSEETKRSIIERCKKLQPALDGLREEDILDVKVGLRPGREKVRLEFESVSNRCGVIHNYGHGGTGFTLSWGCAEEVLRLALEHF
jgi:D-amino-acid oxidase